MNSCGICYTTLQISSSVLILLMGFRYMQMRKGHLCTCAAKGHPSMLLLLPLLL